VHKNRLNTQNISHALPVQLKISKPVLCVEEKDKFMIGKKDRK